MSTTRRHHVRLALIALFLVLAAAALAGAVRAASARGHVVAESVIDGWIDGRT